MIVNLYMKNNHFHCDFRNLKISDFVTIAKPKDNMLTVSNHQRAKFKEIFFKKWVGSRPHF